MPLKDFLKKQFGQEVKSLKNSLLGQLVYHNNKAKVTISLSELPIIGANYNIHYIDEELDNIKSHKGCQ